MEVTKEMFVELEQEVQDHLDAGYSMIKDSQQGGDRDVCMVKKYPDGRLFMVADQSLYEGHRSEVDLIYLTDDDLALMLYWEGDQS